MAQSENQINKTLLIVGLALSTIMATGTFGYWYIGGRQHSFLDCFYMTMITISTIGFKEVIDLSNNAPGRLFTIFIAFSGIGVLTYAVTTFTATIVEGEIKETFQKKKIKKMIENMQGHFIVCGLGRLGAQIVEELYISKRPQIILDTGEHKCKAILDRLSIKTYLVGDATEDQVLSQAGIEKAKGIFAATGDDNTNLVISLSAKYLNPKVKVVARCEEPGNVEKMKKAGADAVISPTTIGGFKMVSDMVRPTMGSLLEMLIRDKFKSARPEEISIPEQFVGKPLSSLNLKNYHDTVVIGIKTAADWVYNPPDDYTIVGKSTLLVLTTTEDRHALEKLR